MIFADRPGKSDASHAVDPSLMSRFRAAEAETQRNQTTQECLAMEYNEEAAIDYEPDAAPAHVERARHKIEQQLRHREGIAGFGITMDPVGAGAIVVYVENREALTALPRSIDGVPVIA
jgi:hypothetical protein